jgi:uncharacterized lipoprotein YddW (UPF0748 family)
MSVVLVLAVGASRMADGKSLLPIVRGGQPPAPAGTEVRAVWVTRFEWASASASEATIEQIVANIQSAGFNTIYFQVRGEADAFYVPGLEPWSEMLSGTLGQDPGWDPLAVMIQKAHEAGIQVHAYINVYPVWLGVSSDLCQAPPSGTSPGHLYYTLQAVHGTTDGKPNGLMWNSSGDLICGVAGGVDYQRASPASTFVDDHLVALANDLVGRYDLDGIHLDHVRYASGASCDPVSLCTYTTGSPSCSPVPACNLTDPAYQNWQRAQVSGTVAKLYNQVILTHSDLWLSAAVWGCYIDYWGIGCSSGYGGYYQDSKGWLASGTIDSISPMIYSSNPSSPFADFDNWATLVADFQATSQGRYIIPGIGAHFPDFNNIVMRIEKARELGTAGHAIFSYSYLNNNQFFDDLAAGPYAEPAAVPPIPWHP